MWVILFLPRAGAAWPRHRAGRGGQRQVSQGPGADGGLRGCRGHAWGALGPWAAAAGVSRVVLAHPPGVPGDAPVSPALGRGMPSSGWGQFFPVTPSNPLPFAASHCTAETGAAFPPQRRTHVSMEPGLPWEVGVPWCCTPQKWLHSQAILTHRGGGNPPLPADWEHLGSHPYQIPAQCSLKPWKIRRGQDQGRHPQAAGIRKLPGLSVLPLEKPMQLSGA